MLLARQEAGLFAARSFPPTLLEWHANIKQTNMALSAMLSDGKYIELHLIKLINQFESNLFFI
jgi:hypothetical protein